MTQAGSYLPDKTLACSAGNFFKADNYDQSQHDCNCGNRSGYADVPDGSLRCVYRPDVSLSFD